MDVTALYFGILAQREVVRALRSSEAGLEEHLRRLDALVAERKAAPLDRLRVDVRLASTRQRRIQEEAGLDVGAIRLAAAVGLDGSATPVSVVGRLDVPAAPPVDAAASLRRALAERADRAALLASIRAQEARLASARGGRWGQLSVQGAYGVRWAIAPTEDPPGVAAAADVGQVGLVLDVPLFPGGRIRAEIREQEARVAAARARLR